MHNRISNVRKAKGLNQVKFAEELNLTRNFISLLETGAREPSERTIKDICSKFDVNEVWLRTGNGKMFMPKDREAEIAKLTVKLLTEESDSFKNRLITALSRLTEEQWELLAEIAEGITKKE